MALLMMNRISLNKSAATLLASLLVLTVFAAVPASADIATPSDRAWGVSYDWAEYGEDVHTLTGLNIDEILAKFSEAAEEAGFEMLIAQVSTGESMFFIEQTVLADEKTVDDLSGMAHQVNQHVTDLTVVNGMKFDMIMLMEWEDPDAGNEDEKITQQGAAIDFSVQMSLDVLLSLNSRYVEYRTTTGNEIVGADMVTTMDAELGFNMNHDSAWTGGDDTINIAMAMSNSIGASIIDSNVEWRLEQPFDVHDSIDTSVTNNFNWICNDDVDELTIKDIRDMEYVGDGEFAESDEVDERQIYTSCGEMTGNYASELNYAFSLSGVPADLMGLDVDTFNIDINDSPQYTGDFTFSPSELDESNTDSLEVEIVDEDNNEEDQMSGHEDEYHGGTDLGIWMFNPDKTYNVAIDDSGTKVEAMSFLGSPVPMPHLAMNVGLLMNAFEGSEDDPGIFEVVGEEVGAIMEELGPEMVGSCDDGYTELSLTDYNDGYEDCMDGSDEVFEHKYDCQYSWGQSIPHEAVNNDVQDCEYGTDESAAFEDMGFECDNGEETIMLYQVNDGLSDCSDGSDEIGFTKEHRFTCVDMSASIPVEYVNDGTAQCADESDEGQDFEPSSELMNVFEHIADSDIGDKLGDFGPALESSMTDGSIEVIEFPFTGADGDLLWYDGAPVGFITFVEEKDSDGVSKEYIFIGPETEGYERAPSSLGFEYLVGTAVSTAIEEVGDVDELSDIVTEENDADGDGIPDQLESVGEMTIEEAQALASGDNDNDGVSNLNDQCPTTAEGTDVGNDGCAVVVTDNGNNDGSGSTTTDDGSGSTTTVEDQVSDDGGMIPSVSFFATVCVLALAGIITSRRD